MNTFISIAWRSIWRNKRRSILTIVMITFGLLLAIVMEAIMLGSYEQIFRSAIDLNLGSIQIHARDYQENQTLAESFQLTPEIEQLLNHDPQLQGWAPRIVSGGMVSVGENTNVALIIGIDPEKEMKISSLKNKMMSGQALEEKYPQLYPVAPAVNPFLASEPNMEIMIGDKLAAKLEARIGDSLAAMVQGADGSMGSDRYTITGVYHTGSPDLDEGFHMHIQEADDLLAMYGQISLLSLALPSSKETPEVLAKIKAQLDLEIYEVMSWDEIAPELVQILALDQISGYMFLVILLIIIAFGILNTIFITIMERIKEFGTLKALGTTPQQIFSLVYYETFLLTLVGIVCGNVLGALLAYMIHKNPIALGSMTAVYEEMGLSMPYLSAEIEPYIFINFSLFVLGLSMLAALYPAIKAARLEPLEALKHT